MHESAGKSVIYQKSLRPEDKPVHMTAGIEESNISEKYYEPPLMQVSDVELNATLATSSNTFRRIFLTGVSKPLMYLPPHSPMSSGSVFVKILSLLTISNCESTVNS